MIKKHVTPWFVWSRLRQVLYEKGHPADPWLTPDSITLIDKLLKPTDVGIEFGSGRSTQWFAQRCTKLTSIENSESWFSIVSGQLRAFRNVEYYLKSVDKENPGQSTYLEIFDSIGNESIDFVLDDGKIRDHVALLSVPKLRAGGVLILDNAERYLPNPFQLPESIGTKRALNQNWENFLTITRSWRRVWTENGVFSTLILFKS